MENFGDSATESERGEDEDFLYQEISESKIAGRLSFLQAKNRLER